MRICFFSIITKSHLAQLTTTAQSIRQFHPEIQFEVCVIDDLFPYVKLDAEHFSFVPAEALESPHQLYRLLKLNSPFELACIFKAKFAKYLIENKNYEQLIYLDVDLYFLNPITDFIEQLKSVNLIITPHLLTSMDNPATEGIWLEAFQIGTGLYNMGFFGLRASETTLSFLEWWDKRTSFRCKRDLGRGFFDDQSWVDPVPIIFKDVFIWTDEGYNVANWNIYERNLTYQNDRFFVNSCPLVFFHFSQANPLQGSHITNYRELLFEDYPALRLLFAKYRDHLLRNNYQQNMNWRFCKVLDVLEVLKDQDLHSSKK